MRALDWLRWRVGFIRSPGQFPPRTARFGWVPNPRCRWPEAECSCSDRIRKALR